jgi:hypothetical protein
MPHIRETATMYNLGDSVTKSGGGISSHDGAPLTHHDEADVDRCDI